MQIQFKRLTPQMADEFFGYFENGAFPENDPRRECYCLESHLSDENRYKTRAERRQKATELIQSGTMTGHLVYDGDRAIGWCNAGDKEDYAPIRENPDFLTPDDERGRIKILYCMDIAPAYQGKGIANRMVERVLSDAAEEGYAHVEGYPFLNRAYIWQYRGPVQLYETHGFARYAEKSWFYIMRKDM